MKDRVNESLSALVDGETDELEIRRLLNECSQNPELSGTWQRYLTIGEVLRDEPISNIDISQGVRQALNGEPMDDLQPTANLATNNDNENNWMRWLSLGSSAAAVTLAVFMGMNFYNQQPDSVLPNVATLQSHSLVGSSVSSVSNQTLTRANESVIAVTNPQDVAKAQQLLNQYLMQHVEDNAMNSVRGIAPLARSASFKQE